MSKERDIPSEKFLNALIALREEKISKSDFIKREINVKKCRALGLFPYIVKKTAENKEEELFVLNEIDEEGHEHDAIYNKEADVVAYHDYSSMEGLKVAREYELDKERLERTIWEARQRNIEDENNASNNSTSKAGDGRDLASKEHEEKPKKENNEIKQEEKTPEEENNKLRNLKGDISMSSKTRIRLDTRINGCYLWEILGIEDTLKDRMPEGVSERAFRNGYLTRIDSKELNELEESRGEKVKERKTEDTLSIVSPNGDIVELDEDVIEPEDLGSREERLLQEQNRERWADGKHTFKPENDTTLTRTSKWRIKNVNSRFTVNEEWFLGVDYNEEYVKNGSKSADPRYLKEISIIQAPKNTDKIYSRDSAEARTMPTIEYKLEDAYEASLNEKERAQMEQVSEKNSNETKNVRREHEAEIETLVENLTKEYGEDYREEIQTKVDKEHKKGNDVDEIEKNVKEDMGEVEEKNVGRENGGELEELVENLTKKYGEDYREEIQTKVEEERNKGKDIDEIEKNVKGKMDELEEEMSIHGRVRGM